MCGVEFKDKQTLFRDTLQKQTRMPELLPVSEPGILDQKCTRGTNASITQQTEHGIKQQQTSKLLRQSCSYPDILRRRCLGPKSTSSDPRLGNVFIKSHVVCVTI